VETLLLPLLVSKQNLSLRLLARTCPEPGMQLERGAHQVKIIAIDAI